MNIPVELETWFRRTIQDSQVNPAETEEEFKAKLQKYGETEMNINIYEQPDKESFSLDIYICIRPDGQVTETDIQEIASDMDALISATLPFTGAVEFEQDNDLYIWKTEILYPVSPTKK